MADTLKAIFLPWLVIAELRAQADYDRVTIDYLSAQIAKFDHDGNGRIGGSRRKA